jgi:hypothetical protein
MRPAFYTTATAVELAVALLQARVLRGALSVDYCKSRGGDLGFRANKGSPMSQSVVAPEYSLPIKLHVQQTQLTEEQFVRLCQENPDLRIELTAQGELVLMPPTGLESGWRNSRLIRRLDTWTEAEGVEIKVLKSERISDCHYLCGSGGGLQILKVDRVAQRRLVYEELSRAHP